MKTEPELLQKKIEAYKAIRPARERKARIKFVLGLGLTLALGGMALKPPQATPAPCNMSSYYISEMVELESQLNKADSELKRLQIQNRKLQFERLNTVCSLNIDTTHSEAFYKAVKRTFKHEGGLGIDNNGYAVNFGINQKWYKPLKGYPKSVKDLTRTQAIEYARINYWLPLNLNAQSLEYKAFIFDTAFNKGVDVGQRIDSYAQGDLKLAKQKRKSHLQKWYKSGFRGTCGKSCLKSLIARVETYKGV
jgi:hypothetical protein